jgi:sRNA-binding carbon storage regulator CsrA
MGLILIRNVGDTIYVDHSLQIALTAVDPDGIGLRFSGAHSQHVGVTLDHDGSSNDASAFAAHGHLDVRVGRRQRGDQVTLVLEAPGHQPVRIRAKKCGARSARLTLDAPRSTHLLRGEISDPARHEALAA